MRVWVQKYETGAFDDDAAANTIQAYYARIAAPERLAGRQALELELEFSKGTLHQRLPPRSGPTSVITEPAASAALSYAVRWVWRAPPTTMHRRGLPTIPPSSRRWRQSAKRSRRMAGARRAGSGPTRMAVNHKKVRRLMRVHDFQPRNRRRYFTTTDSDHESPIFPTWPGTSCRTGQNQLWVADLTYVAVMDGFV